MPDDANLKDYTFVFAELINLEQFFVQVNILLYNTTSLSNSHFKKQIHVYTLFDHMYYANYHLKRWIKIIMKSPTL